jgi:hypothetical protein
MFVKTLVSEYTVSQPASQLCKAQISHLAECCHCSNMCFFHSVELLSLQNRFFSLEEGRNCKGKVLVKHKLPHMTNMELGYYTLTAVV